MFLVCGYVHIEKKVDQVILEQIEGVQNVGIKIALEETKINYKWDLCGSRLTPYLVMVHARPLFFFQAKLNTPSLP
jgi:hypothetical protein